MKADAASACPYSARRVWDAAAEDGTAVDSATEDGTVEDGAAEIFQKGERCSRTRRICTK